MTSGHGLTKVPLAIEPLTRKNFTSDQEVRWCPGCGDYSILAAFQGILPELGIRRENTVIVSGIGCSSRFPYYVDSYGLHSIHGRATAIATGVATAREDLAVFVVTGDGDALSIGGNHLIHAMRRNVNMTILLFNNRIYGLTKGQYSPTSETGKITKSSPMGSLDTPFNAVSLALGAEASFVARAVDSDRAGLTEALRAATQHRGASLVEIYQNCPIFNDGAFDGVKGADAGVIPLVQDAPIIFGPDGSLCVTTSGRDFVIANTADTAPEDIIIHDAHTADPSYAFALSRIASHGDHSLAPIGIFRDVERPSYDDGVREQIASVSNPSIDRTTALETIFAGSDTWFVS